ncbi:MAG TPA: hypothetical protein VJH03_18500 [Blastocatellia bacterium]|nr:hypothetical protein [Blastocatellia bacterium]
MPNGAKEKLMGPAIGLIVTGALNAMVGLLFTISGVIQLGQGPRGMSSDAEEAGWYAGAAAALGCGVLSVLLSPLIIYGASQMLKAKNYGLSKTAAILAIIPCTSICCLAGVPLGIWAVVTLNKPEVKLAFEGAPPSAPNPNANPWTTP